MASVFRAKSIHGSHIADLHGSLAPSAAHQCAQVAQLECPVGYLAGLFFHVQIKVRVGIHPLDLRNGASYTEGLVAVVLGRERMMGEQRCRGSQKNADSEGEPDHQIRGLRETTYSTAQ